LIHSRFQKIDGNFFGRVYQMSEHVLLERRSRGTRCLHPAWAAPQRGRFDYDQELEKMSQLSAAGNVMIPKLAVMLGLVGIVCLVLSALVGATSMADFMLDAAQAFLILAAILIEGYVIGGIVMDVMHAT
jgi:hypothetical protein